MKKLLIYTSTFVLMITLAHAQTNYLTVSNDVNSPGMYTDLQLAIDDASSGDIIYVSGTPTSYGSVTIAKSLTLIGAGYFPHNQFEHTTSISLIELQDGCAGTTIMGFHGGNIYCENHGDFIDDITIKRNNINHIRGSYESYGHIHSNWTIANNIINDIASRCLNASQINNNIITEGISNIPTGFSVNITNNIFIDYTSAAFIYVNDAIISNNIFYGPTPEGATNCTFNNNINIGPEDFLYGSNTGINNLNNTDPMFNIAGLEGDPFDYVNDYRLQDPGSPGLSYGTDGTDVGIYGGAFIFPNAGDVPYLYRAMPQIPQIIYMNINNSTIPVEGTLNIDVEAKIQE